MSNENVKRVNITVQGALGQYHELENLADDLELDFWAADAVAESLLGSKHVTVREAVDILNGHAELLAAADAAVAYSSGAELTSRHRRVIGRLRAATARFK